MRNINKDKFEAPVFEGLLLAIPQWERALGMVVREWRRIKNHPNTSLMRGYAFLDPYVLMKKETGDNRIKTYLLLWCSMRSQWYARITNYTEDQIFPSPQDWKQFLIDDVAANLQFSSRGAMNSSRVNAMLKTRGYASLVEMFGLEMSNFNAGVSVWWRNVVLTKGGTRNVARIHLSSQIFREVIWDLFESNFKIEVLSLDCSIFPRDRLGEFWSSRRDTMVAACFPRQTFFNINFPVEDEGLGAACWQDRVVFLEAFRVLLASWPGTEAEVLRNMQPLVEATSNSPGSTQTQVEQVENVALPFYCQVFFDYFGRAPSIPCVRP